MKIIKAAPVILAAVLVCCQTPSVPAEVEQAERQDNELWKAGASVFAGQDYDEYVRDLKGARQTLASENLKLGWFRNYAGVQKEFRAVLASGENILARVRNVKSQQLTSLSEALQSIRNRAGVLADITLSIGERGAARERLTQAEIYLREAEMLLDQEKYTEASQKLSSAGEITRAAEEAVLTHIGRYLDKDQVAVWQKWANMTIAESRRKRTLAIIVSKLERKLTVYQRGIPFRSYDIGLGFNGLSTKMRSGDNATPEGRYKIIRKNARSRFHRALLLDYPNEEDKRRFANAQRDGTIPETAGIGGNIEIHGGGKNSLTEGCISMDNVHMEELFSLVSVGTPVTIIGTIELENFVIRAIQDDKSDGTKT